VKKGAKGHWAGDRKQTTVWHIAKPKKNETGHGTQKPVECMKRPIENNSSPGQAVYEPFSGSGTTIIAGEMTGRAIHAIELNPAYVDVAVKRWQDFTGHEARLEGDGRTFAEISAGQTQDMSDETRNETQADPSEAGHR
jgi:DNA modification methylase